MYRFSYLTGLGRTWIKTAVINTNKRCTAAMHTNTVPLTCGS